MYPQATAGLTPLSTNSAPPITACNQISSASVRMTVTMMVSAMVALTDPHAQNLVLALPPQGPRGPSDFHHAALLQVYLPERL